MLEEMVRTTTKCDMFDESNNICLVDGIKYVNFKTW
jgi:hypothetical protein